MAESNNKRKKRLEHVALLTERLHRLEALLAAEHDEETRKNYEDELSAVREMIHRSRSADSS